MSLYATTLLVYALIDIIAVLALNLQFGFAGIANFAFILYVSIGGYAYALLTLGSSATENGFQHYFAATHLPFPLPFLIAGLIGCVAGALTGLLLLRRLRVDYQAVAFVALFFVGYGIATGVTGLVNGSAGLSLIPQPLASHFSVGGQSYGWFYVILSLVFCAASFWVLRRLGRAPWGRLLRAVSENEVACAALGKRGGWVRYSAFIVGSGFAALSGALLVGFLTTWGPAAWSFPETVVFFTALVVGGIRNNWGASLGVVIVGVVIAQLPLFLPNFVSANTLGALQWIIIGGLTLAFIWFRPQGLIPARVPRYTRVRALSAGAKDVAEGPHVATLATPGVEPVVTRRERPEEAGHVMLEVKGVSRTFGGVHAVEEVSFKVEAGTLVGLMGPNGAGKSSLLAMLAGELPTTAGSIWYEGKDITRLGAAARARLGLIRTFQLSSEFRELSVLENLVMGQQRHPGERLALAMTRRRWRPVEEAAIERAWSLLEDFNLARFANDRAAGLSGGQRRLVELLRALMAQPRVLLLDEPLAGIARSMADEFLDMLARLRGNGMTIILVEHELRALHRLADNVIVMARGQKVADGGMVEVVDLPEVIQSYVAG